MALPKGRKGRSRKGGMVVIGQRPGGACRAQKGKEGKGGGAEKRTALTEASVWRRDVILIRAPWTGGSAMLDRAGCWEECWCGWRARWSCRR